MKRTVSFVLSMLMTVATFAQAQESSGDPPKTRSGGSTSSDLKELKDAIAAQQQQILQLQQQVQSRDQAIQQLQQQVNQATSTAQQAQQAANAAAGAANQQNPTSASDITGLQHEVADLKTVSASNTDAIQETQKRLNEDPIAIHYKGISITPGGFLAAETYWRDRATSGEATAFSSIPFAGAAQAQSSEFYGSGRQSRLSILATGKVGSITGTGYYEADFLSAGVTSNNNQTNSYTLRQRQAYAQAALANGWTFTGGQMWTLLTETKKGLDNRTEATPMTIDPNYNVGFTFARQYGFRVTKNFNNKVWVGFSVENPQINNLTVSGIPTTAPLPTGTAITNSCSTFNVTKNTCTAAYNGFFLIGAAGNAGGLYNGTTANYSFNYIPDFIVKVAFEPGFGHYEIFGLVSSFRDRIYPNANPGVAPYLTVGGNATGATNKSVEGGGIGANARWSMMQKHIDFGLHAFGGPGTGRYAASGLTDVTIHPDGSLALVHSIQGLGTLEYHSQKWDIYTNVGVDYAGKVAYYYPVTGSLIGYGLPTSNNSGCYIETLPTGTTGFVPGSLSNCSGNVREMIEGTAGFWYKFYNGPKGRLQFGSQVSYIVKNTWAGQKGIQPSANDTLVGTSFRYYLP